MINWVIGLGGYMVWLRMRATQPVEDGAVVSPVGAHLVRSTRGTDSAVALKE